MIRVRNIKDLFKSRDFYKQIINDIKYQLLKDCIKSYNEAQKDLNLNGNIVESYKQKYLNPSYKIKEQSLKDIIKIISLIEDDTNDDCNERRKEELLKELLL